MLQANPIEHSYLVGSRFYLFTFLDITLQYSRALTLYGNVKKTPKKKRHNNIWTQKREQQKKIFLKTTKDLEAKKFSQQKKAKEKKIILRFQY